MTVESVRWWGCHDAKAPRKERKHIELGKEGDATSAMHYVQKLSGQKGIYFKFRTQSLANWIPSLLEINDGDPAWYDAQTDSVGQF
jgi:hypothetical protein